ncbi:hypothetical protein LAD77_01170 [Klebsiella pneumoniae]|nr:hypothetical protein [Klebsiella pneumoniae]
MHSPPVMVVAPLTGAGAGFEPGSQRIANPGASQAGGAPGNDLRIEMTMLGLREHQVAVDSPSSVYITDSALHGASVEAMVGRSPPAIHKWARLSRYPGFCTVRSRSTAVHFVAGDIAWR